MSRTHRRQYTGSRRIDATCRNQGSCPWCAANRQFRHRKGDVAFKELEKHYDTESSRIGT